MSFDSLGGAWFGPALALALSLGWSALFVGLRRPGLATMALPLALAIGWLALLGVPTGSPRRLPERLPALALGLAALALPLALATPRLWLWGVLGAAGGSGGAWWLAGGPLTEADLRRTAPLLAALALLTLTLLLETRSRWPALAAAGALAVALWGAAALSPWAMLGVALLAAAAPALLLAPGPACFAPLAVAMAALAVGPVLARGGAADWMALAAPLAVLLLGQRLGPWGLAVGVLPAALAWFL